MGFYSFWYNIKFLLKRLPKKILVGICIFLIITICHLKGYCSQVNVNNLPNYDVVQLTKDKFQRDFDILLYQEIVYAKNYNNNEFHSMYKEFLSNIWWGKLGYWISTESQGEYFSNVSGHQPLYTYYGFVALNQSYTETTITNYQSGNSTSSVPYLLDAEIYSNGYVGYINFSNTGVPSVPTSWARASITIPVGLNKMFREDQWQTIKDIASDQFSFDNVETLLTNIDNNIQTLNDNIENMNDFLQNTTTSQYSSSDLPSDSMNDITSSGFNNIFTRIYNSVTLDSNPSVTITIPYLNYPVTIDSHFIFNALYFNGFSSILNIIATVYYGLISLYIIKDIYKYINQIKNGDIGHTDTNIKTEVL